MTPIDKLREALTKLGARALAGGLPVYLGEPLTEARAALDELSAKLAEASAVNDRIATILDEAVSMMPVMPAQEALTLLEEHVHSLRMAVEIAQRREPTQAEGDAHARKPDGSLADECFVPAGGWTGRRCRACCRWVWGGPTACVQCAERITELEAALAGRDRRIAALEIRRSESRQLLHRLTKYVKEDRATTPGKTRLARLTDQVADYLARTGEPTDIVRGGDAAPPAPAPENEDVA